MSRFDPYVIIDTLNRHDVEYVIVGDIAASLWGIDSARMVFEVCYRLQDDNVDKLAAALQELNAQERGVANASPITFDRNTFQNSDHFTLWTLGGALDCVATPAGVKSYDDLFPSSWTFDLDGRPIRVCSLEDLIRTREAAGRTQDKFALEQLYALKKLIESGAGNS